MKIENQYCTRDQAIRLKELGVWQPQDTDEWKPGDFYSVLMPQSGETKSFVLGNQEDAPYKRYEPIRLFSVAELGVMIPDGCCPDYVDSLARYAFQDTISRKVIANSLESEIRAAYLIDILEAGEITVAEVNQRLQNS